MENKKNLQNVTKTSFLHSFNLYQHITKPTRKGKSLIDHICSNVPKKLVHNNVIYTDEISDYDTPFVILNLIKERYEPGYKYIRDERKVDMNQYVNDFSKLPLNLVYGFKEPECQISILNKLFSDCLESHASTRRVKLTRPICPLMKDPTIVSDHQKLELSRMKSHDNKNPKEHQKSLEDKKQYKKTIKDKKNSLFGKAVSSKNPKTVWSSIDRILKKQQKRINHEPFEMNNYFSNLAVNLTKKENTERKLTSLLNNLSDENYDQCFHLNRKNYNEVYKIITNLKNDYSSGHDNIPVRYLKPVAGYITSPMVHIINTWIGREIFPKQWKISRVCPTPKTDNPTSIKDY